MDARKHRVAKNETLFREVNERIEEVNRSLGAADEADFLCECGDEGCTEPISLTMREYEELRRDPRHFAIVPGHDVLDVERIVAQNQRYAVVEKFEALARIAVERDPRA